MNIFLALFLSFMVAGGFSGTAGSVSAESHQFQAVTLAKDTVINKDYFTTGDTVTILGTVNGDAYIAGGTVIVDGIINGDLLVAGGTVTIRGTVRDDVRAAGGQINLAGDVGRNVTTLGGTVTISESASVSGSLADGSGSISIFSPIGKEANIAAGQVTLDSLIHGDVQAGIGNLTLTPNAKILGNLTYWSEEKALLDSPSQITGVTTYNSTPRLPDESKKAKPSYSSFNPTFSFLSFLAASIVGALIVLGIPTFAMRTTEIVKEKPFQSFGVGLLSVVLAPFVFLLLLITVIGIPLDLILLTTFVICMYMSKIIVGIAIGEKVLHLLNKKAALGWSMVGGLSIYYIITMIPVIGFFFWMIAGFTGLGALLIQGKTIHAELRKKELV